MDSEKLQEMLKDKHFHEYKKLKHKYGRENFEEMVRFLRSSMYRELPLMDFQGRPLIYIDRYARGAGKAAAKLIRSGRPASYSVQAMSEELFSSMKIENIESSKEQIGRIMTGEHGLGKTMSKEERRILAMKRGIDFVSNPDNELSEENLRILYKTAIEPSISEDEYLPEGGFYRNAPVYIVGRNLSREGLPAEKLPEYMAKFFNFLCEEDSGMEELMKAAAAHFYLAYLHPYFDGNGRTARLLHLWYLIQRGYSGASFVSLSKYVEASRDAYYKVFRQVEENAEESGVLDLTPFLLYFDSEVYAKLAEEPAEIYDNLLSAGRVSLKEKALWDFVQEHYAGREFSTKELERDFGQAAYATIRSFVQKFEKEGLLSVQVYANRPRYRLVER